MSDPEEIRAAKRLASLILVMGGPDLTGLSDDELLETMEEVFCVAGDAIKMAGVSAEEVSKPLQKLGAAMAVCGNFDPESLRVADDGQGD
ncbi:MAG: hypothetical protein KDJ54_19570 [Candidatus Competibacteraceae bacterium]|nr:hypothetical protein [Candidatus Competibacteraceae bacterium]